MNCPMTYTQTVDPALSERYMQPVTDQPDKDNGFAFAASRTIDRLLAVVRTDCAGWDRIADRVLDRHSFCLPIASRSHETDFAYRRGRIPRR